MPKFKVFQQKNGDLNFIGEIEAVDAKTAIKEARSWWAFKHRKVIGLARWPVVEEKGVVPKLGITNEEYAIMESLARGYAEASV